MFTARIARQSDIGEFLFALNGYLAHHCADNSLSHRASVVIEELVVNAFWHGAAESAGGVGVELAVEPPGLRGTVTHDGPPFDPGALTADPAEGSSDPSDERASGRGLRLVRAFTRTLDHRRVGGANRVRFEIAPA